MSQSLSKRVTFGSPIDISISLVSSSLFPTPTTNSSTIGSIDLIDSTTGYPSSRAFRTTVNPEMNGVIGMWDGKIANTEAQQPETTAMLPRTVRMTADVPSTTESTRRRSTILFIGTCIVFVAIKLLFDNYPGEYPVKGQAAAFTWPLVVGIVVIGAPGLLGERSLRFPACLRVPRSTRRRVEITALTRVHSGAS